MNRVSFKRLSDAEFDRLEKEGGGLVVVREGHAPMVAMRLADRQAMDDTTSLLSDPAYNEMPLRSIAEFDTGKGFGREPIDP